MSLPVADLGTMVPGGGLLGSSTGDLGFMIKGIFPYELFGQTVWITTTHVSLFIVMAILVIFAIAANRKMAHAKEVPTGFQNVVELIVEKLDGMVEMNLGKYAPGFRNYIGTLFIFILFSNVSGLLGLRAPTADYGVTFPLGLITFGIVQYCNFKYNKPIGVLKGLMEPWPFWIPINLISEVAVPVSISLRLFANILSGTVVMALIYGLLGKIATAWPAALHVYFDLFSGAIQTYVFCMLTMAYIGDKIGDN